LRRASTGRIGLSPTSAFLNNKALKLRQPQGPPEFRLTGFGSLKLYDVLGLKTLGALGHFKFHGLLFGQGLEALAQNGTVVHKDIRAVFPCNEAKTFSVVKPFHRTSFFQGETSSKYCKDIPAKKAGPQSSQLKKNRPGIQHPRPILVQDLWPCFQSDMLNLCVFYKKIN
jgi:hypothetical protein